MRNFSKLTATLVLAITLTFSLAACDSGASDPKSLAKQTVELMKQGKELDAKGVKETDPAGVKLKNKSDEMEKKIEGLSKEDSKVYLEELGKLMKEMK
jgi:uncharacterized lipoprotein YehR (DUF1307 family)